jgi:hypothetical protein
MKITSMPDELFRELRVQWEKNTSQMTDADRSIENLVYLLTSDNGDSQWYALADTDVVFFIRNVIPNLSAVFFALNLEEAQPQAARDEIRGIMREFDVDLFYPGTGRLAGQGRSKARLLA